jgi:hypothetical protein
MGAVQQQRLQREGFRLEVTRAGKHYYWREPETGRRLSPPHAAELLRQKDWPRPSSGRLYPRGGAHDLLLLLSTVEEGG